MASPNDVPRVAEPIAGSGGFVTRAWLDFFLKLASTESQADLAALYAALAARVAELEENEGFTFQIIGQGAVSVNGTPQPGGFVVISLDNDVDNPGNTMYYGTGPTGERGWFPVSGTMLVEAGQLTKTVAANGVTTFGLAPVPDSGTGALRAFNKDAYGRVTGTKDATITGTSGQVNVANGDAVAGLPTISLADVADSGSGALLATTFDAKGRKIGSRVATITGTTNQINVANGTAAAGLPTLSLAAAVLTSLGKADSALQSGADHNTQLSGLQGGTSGQYYHATAAQNAALAALATSGFIDGLRMVRNSGTSITFTTGVAAIQSTGSLLTFPSDVTKSSLSLSASTLHYVYAYSNAGTPDVEITTTLPAAPYFGLARSKTGDTSRRYIGAFLTKADGTLYNFEHSAGYITYRESTDTAPFRVLANGVATTQTVVSVASAGVPISAKKVNLNVTNLSTNSALLLSNPSASTINMQGIRPGNGFAMYFPVDASLQMTYLYSGAPVGGGGYIDVIGYAVER